MDASSTVYENAVYHNGKLDGDDVYIGRVYDGQCVLIGTAIPKKGVCIYLNKQLEVKSSSNYEVIFMSFFKSFYISNFFKPTKYFCLVIYLF